MAKTVIGAGVDSVFQIASMAASFSGVREHSHSRKQMIPTTTEMSYGYYPSMPVEVVVGGATIFVVDIERFERV